MIYPFKCKDCYRYLELEMKLKEYESFNFICPICNGQLERVYDKMNFVLKGSGWFKDHQYGITEREMSRNRDVANKQSDKAEKQMKKSKEI